MTSSTIKRMLFRSQFTSEPAEKLAQKIANLAEGDLNWSFFC